jgi:hypothetical protein
VRPRASKEGQFIATLHAAKDLNVSFASLKAELTSPHDNLSRAIDVAPTSDAKAAARAAAQEARTDIKSPTAHNDLDD